MSLEIKMKGLGSLTEAENSVVWNSVTIGAEEDETDVFLQGTQSVSAQASNKAGELYYDIAADFGRVLDFDVGGTEEGQLIFMWVNVTTLGILDTLANRGLAIRLYTTSTNWADWVIAGSGAIQNFRGGKGGWTCFALDPRLPATLENGTFDSGSVDWMGIHIDVTSSAKVENLMIDHITVGEGVHIVGTGDFADLANYCNDFGIRAWGAIQYDDAENVIYSMGKIFIGSGDQAVITRVPDADRIIQFISTDYYNASAQWVPMVDPSFHEIVVEDNITYPTEWVDGVQVGDDRGRNGSLIVGNSGAVDLRIQMSGANASSYVKLYGTTIKYAEGGITGSEDSDYEMFSVTVDNCGQFDPLGGMRVRECTFSNTLDDSGAVLWNSAMSLLGGNFIANSFGIQVDVAGSITVSGTQFSANTYDGWFTASTGLLTVNTTQSNIAIFQSGVDTEVSIVNSVTVAVSVVNQTNIAISGVRYGVYNTGGALLDSGMTDSNGSFSFPYNYLGNLDIDVNLRRSTPGITRYFPQSNPGVIQAGGFSAKYTMIEDGIA